MSIISNSSYSDMDKEILYEEYIRFRNEIKSYSKETPYYVYALCEPNGEPIYIGKGKNNRAFDHLKGFINNKTSNKYLFKKLQALGNEPPIMFILKGNLSQLDALELEKSTVSEYGRFFEGGQLTNIAPGGDSYSNDSLSSLGGKIGGRTTKDNNLGIFSPSYDRGKQTKSNFDNGLMDHIDYQSIGSLGGNTAVELKLGIHDPNYKDKRSEWARHASEVSYMKNGPTGPASEQWCIDNSYDRKAMCAKGGRVGGKISGAQFWWNNGIVNKKSLTQPPGYVRGMLQSEKKLLSLQNNFNLNKRKKNV